MLQYEGMAFMEEQSSIFIIKKEGLDTILNDLIQTTGIIISDFYYNLLFDIGEKTPEENLELIELTREMKESIFLGLLDFYNDFLKDKTEIENKLKEENVVIESLNELLTDINNKLIAIVTISAIVIPKIAPVITLVSVLKIAQNYLQIVELRKEMEDNNQIMTNYQKFYQTIYKYIDNLRTDYHRSKKELDALEVRAKNGEDIMDDLLKIVNPESIGFELSPLSVIMLQDSAYSEEDEEKAKQLVNNNQNY